MYAIAIGMVDVAEAPTLEEAFKIFHAKIMEIARSPTGLHAQFLDSCWIKDSDRATPFFFNEIVEIAHANKWLENKT